MFKLGRHTFDIARTEFRSHLSIGMDGWRAGWTLEIEAKPRVLEDTNWEPKLRSHMNHVDLPHPLLLAGTKLGPIPHDEHGEPAFLLYNFEHDPVDNPELHFAKRNGSSFLIEFRGAVPNFIDEGDAEVVPIQIEGWLPFEGVFIDEIRVEKARQRLEMLVGLSGWSDPIRHENLWLYRLQPDA